MYVTSLILSLSILIAASSAFGATGKVLITKTNGPGYTHPDWARSETCQIRRDAAVIVKRYGNGPDAVVLRQEIPISLSENVAKLIDAAAKDALTKTDNGLCDAPMTWVGAHLPGDRNDHPSVSLFASGGCGSPRENREGPAADALRDIVNRFCPTTFDYH